MIRTRFSLSEFVFSTTSVTIIKWLCCCRAWHNLDTGVRSPLIEPIHCCTLFWFFDFPIFWFFDFLDFCPPIDLHATIHMSVLLSHCASAMFCKVLVVVMSQFVDKYGVPATPLLALLSSSSSSLNERMAGYSSTYYNITLLQNSSTMVVIRNVCCLWSCMSCTVVEVLE